MQYDRYLDEQLRLAQMQINRINRIATLSDIPEILNDVDSLKFMIQEKFRQVSCSKETLTILQKQFFDQLNCIGKKVGIPLPEPDEIELIKVRHVDLVPALKEILVEQLNCDADSINEDTSFKDDLGADSLDLYEMVMALEDEYGIEIDTDELTDLSTVGDFMEYLKQHGVEV